MANDGQVSKDSVEAARKKANAKKGNKLLSFPTEQMPHTILLVFKQYEYAKWADSKRQLLSVPTRGRSTRNQVELNGTVGIQLPFPKTLVDSSDIRISTFERNAMVEAAIALPGVSDMLKGKGSVGDGLVALKDAATSAAGAVFGATKDAATYLMENDASQIKADAAGLLDSQMGSGTDALAYLLRTKGGSLLGGTGIATMNSFLGQAVNPRETLTFEGIGLKQHSFEWELYPSNRNDSEMIKKIVSTVKANTLPGTENFFGIPRVLLNFPSTVDMYLLGVNQDHFLKFKTCMVTGVSVNYSAGGGITAIAKGGVPAAVSLSMNFQELDIETADDYPEGLLPDEVTTRTENDGAETQGTAGEQNSGGT